MWFRPLLLWIWILRISCLKKKNRKNYMGCEMGLCLAGAPSHENNKHKALMSIKFSSTANLTLYLNQKEINVHKSQLLFENVINVMGT